jgi:hypothetical protein
MSARSPDLQQLLDRTAIQDALTRYYHAADSGNRDLLRSCFTEDVRAHYIERTPVSGLDALMAQIPLFDKLASGAMKICTHFMGNLRFLHLAADTAETETYVLAFLVVPRAGADDVQVRSFRYLDRWARTGEWKICARVLTLDWSCDVPATFASALSQRVKNLPDHMLS